MFLTTEKITDLRKNKKMEQVKIFFVKIFSFCLNNFKKMLVFLFIIVFLNLNITNYIANTKPYKWFFDNNTYQKEMELTYKLPNFNSIKGQMFNLSFYKYLEEFKLRSIDNDYIDITAAYNLEPTIVTAFSQNHFSESMNLFYHIYKYLPNYKIVVYDLGLNEDSAKEVKNYCNVEYRKFNFTKYPPHVTQLNYYAWKPIIIAEALRDFKSIWYADTSVIFKRSDLSRIHALVTCRHKYADNHKSLEQMKIKESFESNGNNQKGQEAFMWKLNVEHCQKSAYLLHSFTGHTILPATHKGVLKYLPTNITLIGRNKNKMYEAGFVFAVKTKDTSVDVLKWYLLCSLEKDCIAPQNSRLLPCNFKNADPSKVSDNCHRYDQSVINILLSNANNFNSENYISQLTDFFEITREGKMPPNTNFKCSQKNFS